jgi:hypothetical protein
VEAGYSGTARELSKRTGLPVKRQNIDEWNRRRVLNKRRERFPEPVREEPHPRPRRPRLLFDVDEVEAWARGGIPGPGGYGWRFPAS